MKTYVYIVAWAVICTIIATALHAWIGWDRDTVMINLYGATWACLAFEVRDQRARAEALLAREDERRQNLLNAMEGRRG